MNIFKVLANGDGSINEPNVSAFLGYLLDPYQDHGMGFEFLDRFLKIVVGKEFQTKKFDYEILFEQAFKGEKAANKSIVDIIILCFKSNRGQTKENIVTDILNNKKELVHVFLIENKTNKVAVEGNKQGRKEVQIQEQFNSTINILKLNQEIVYSVYVTIDDIKAVTNFGDLTNTKKTHFIWKNNSVKKIENELFGLLKKLIVDESNGEIEPINIYTKQTLIAFIKFIESGFKSQVEEKEKYLIKEYGNIETAINFLKNNQLFMFSFFLIRLDDRLKSKGIEFKFKTNGTNPKNDLKKENSGKKISESKKIVTLVIENFSTIHNMTSKKFARLEFGPNNITIEKFTIENKQHWVAQNKYPLLSKRTFNLHENFVENETEIFNAIVDSYEYFLKNQPINLANATHLPNQI